MRKLDRLLYDFFLPACLLGCIIFLVMFATTGCTLLGEVSERAAEEIGEGVKIYCEETIPDVRETFRNQVNQYAAPHSVRVTCADDTVLTTEEFPQ